LNIGQTWVDACSVKRSVRVLWVTLSLGGLIMAAHALPAAAHSFGPAFYCDAGALSNCTDTVDATFTEDAFDCGGEARGIASCTNRTTGNSWPYCEFMGNEASKSRDAYMCGSALDLTDEVVDDFWQQRETARGS
jgi:hypothetical protein